MTLIAVVLLGAIAGGLLAGGSRLLLGGVVLIALPVRRAAAGIAAVAHVLVACGSTGTPAQPSTSAAASQPGVSVGIDAFPYGRSTQL